MFHEDNSIVSILEVSNASRDQMWDHTLNVAGTVCVMKQQIQGIHHKVKQQRREGVTLTNPSPVSEEVPYFSVYGDRGLGPGDQAERPVYPTRVKTFRE